MVKGSEDDAAVAGVQQQHSLMSVAAVELLAAALELAAVVDGVTSVPAEGALYA
jgi:hypothetical protein